MHHISVDLYSMPSNSSSMNGTRTGARTGTSSSILVQSALAQAQHRHLLTPDLLPILQRLFHWSFLTISSEVSQANAQGFRVQLFYKGEQVQVQEQEEVQEKCAPSPPPPHAGPSQVFVKRIIASDYIITKKDWPDLRRTLMYARTEVRLCGTVSHDVSTRI
jgi:hypothetical protein